MYNQYLEHHGILGMRWGRRGHANVSGTTKSSNSIKDIPEEKLRSSVQRLNLEKQYKDLSKESKPASKVEKTKKVIDSASTLVNQAQKIHKESMKASKGKMNLNNMTDQQLRERINRTNLEKQYSDMFGSETQTISKGKKYASNVLGVAGTALALGSSALGIALSIKELRK